MLAIRNTAARCVELQPAEEFFAPKNKIVYRAAHRFQKMFCARADGDGSVAPLQDDAMAWRACRYTVGYRLNGDETTEHETGCYE